MTRHAWRNAHQIADQHVAAMRDIETQALAKLAQRRIQPK
jgi:hypothetical protein